MDGADTKLMCLDSALQKRIGAYTQRLDVLSPAMRNVVSRHDASSVERPNASEAPCGARTQPEPPASVVNPRFGLLRRRKDPLDKILGQREHCEGVSGPKPEHWSFRKLSEMRDVSWEAFRQECGIHVQAHSFRSAGGLHGLHSTSIHPIRCWDELAPSLRAAPLLQFLNERYPFPTAIQAQSLPISTWRGAPPSDEAAPSALATSTAAKGYKLDLLGIAETGSGKTMCYLVPMMEHILTEEEPLTSARAELGPLALILVPTRELAEQVFSEAERIRTSLVATEVDGHYKCCPPQNLRFAKIVGGESTAEQHAIIAKGVHLMIGTPGQLDALLEQHYLSLGNTRFVAVDEADRMVEERMTEQLCNVLQHAPIPRQTIMFTATMVPECQDIATRFLSPRGYFVLRTPYTFQSIWQSFELFPVITSAAAGGAPAADVVIELKIARLAQWIAYQPGNQAIVFVNEKSTCDMLGKRLRELGTRIQKGLDEVIWNVGAASESASLEVAPFEWLGKQRNTTADYSPFNRVAVAHAGLTQQERRSVIQQFQSGNIRVLVTTDLLARGLDVDRLGLVVNFELPDARDHTTASRNNNVATGNAAGEDLALMKYIHRIGRTGRAGNKGLSVSFVSLPMEMLQRSATVVSNAAKASAAGIMDSRGPRDGRSATTDEDIEDELGMGKRGRQEQSEEVDAPLFNDERLLAPLFRFLRDCALHSGAVRTEETFVSDSRKHAVPRCAVPEPLLLCMQCAAQRMTHGAIRL